jgi:hypothetical protein
MHFDRTELQLLALATRRAAWAARDEQHGRALPRLDSADAFERLATRLESALVRPDVPESADDTRA